MGHKIRSGSSLPVCISQGKIKAEAIENIREAIDGYVAALEEDGLAVRKKRLMRCLLRYERVTRTLRPIIW